MHNTFYIYLLFFYIFFSCKTSIKSDSSLISNIDCKDKKLSIEHYISAVTKKTYCRYLITIEERVENGDDLEKRAQKYTFDIWPELSKDKSWGEIVFKFETGANAFIYKFERDELYFFIANNYRIQNKLDSALKYFELAEAQNPTKKYHSQEVALCLIDLKKYELAKNKATILIKRDSLDYLNYFILGKAHLFSDKAQDSTIILFKKAIGILDIQNNSSKERSILFAYLSDTYFKANSLEKAIETATTSIEIDNTNKLGYANKGNVLLKKGIPREALYNFDLAKNLGDTTIQTLTQIHICKNLLDTTIKRK